MDSNGIHEPLKKPGQWIVKIQCYTFQSQLYGSILFFFFYLGFPFYTLRTMCILSVAGEEGELILYMLVVIDL